MGNTTLYASAGLSVAKNSGQDPAVDHAGKTVVYVTAGLPPAAATLPPLLDGNMLTGGFQTLSGGL